MKRKSVLYYFAYLLPILHVMACLATLVANRMNLESGWEYVGLFDYPISIAAVGLAWRYRVPPFLSFVIIGTLWWYFLSRLAVFLIDKTTGFRKKPA